MHSKTSTEILDTIPVIVTGDTCQKCGATKGSEGFSSYNIDEDWNVTDCDQCGKRMQ